MNKMTAKLILGFSSVIMASIAGADQPPVPAPAAVTPPAATDTSGPRIQFQTNLYNFGKVKSGDPVKYTYIFTNVGTELLILSNVQPSCGCTTAGEWSHQVEPGKTGSIPVQFNSGNYNGSVMKTITVSCNDKTQPTIGLQLTGTIWKPIDVNPQFAVLNVPADSQEPVKTVVHVVNNMDEPLAVFSPESNNKAFTAELKTNQVNKDFEVTISTVPPLEAGNVQAQISLKTSSTNAPVLNLTAWANVQVAIIVSPPQITLPAGPLAAKQTATVTIQNNTTNNSFKVSDPVIAAKGVEVSLAEPTPGRTFTATLSFPEGFEVPAGTPVELSLKSTHPRHAVIKVPVTQMPRPVVIPPQQPAVIPTTPVTPPAAAKTPEQAAKPAGQ